MPYLVRKRVHVASFRVVSLFTVPFKMDDSSPGNGNIRSLDQIVAESTVRSASFISCPASMVDFLPLYFMSSLNGWLPASLFNVLPQWFTSCLNGSLLASLFHVLPQLLTSCHFISCPALLVYFLSLYLMSYASMVDFLPIYFLSWPDCR